MALVVLIACVLVVQSNSADLVDERLSGIRLQALIVAGTLAEYTANSDTRTINVEQAEPLLRQLIAPTKLRARLYGTSGRLIIDTRNLLSRNVVQIAELPPIDFWSRTMGSLRRFYDGLMGVRPFESLEPYFEGGKNGRIYSRSGSRARRRRAPRPNVLLESTSRTGLISFRSPSPVQAASRRSMACCWFPPKAATLTTSCARNARP